MKAQYFEMNYVILSHLLVLQFTDFFLPNFPRLLGINFYYLRRRNEFFRNPEFREFDIFEQKNLALKNTK